MALYKTKKLTIYGIPGQSPRILCVTGSRTNIFLDIDDNVTPDDITGIASAYDHYHGDFGYLTFKLKGQEVYFSGHCWSVFNEERDDTHQTTNNPEHKISKMEKVNMNILLSLSTLLKKYDIPTFDRFKDIFEENYRLIKILDDPAGSNTLSLVKTIDCQHIAIDTLKSENKKLDQNLEKSKNIIKEKDNKIETLESTIDKLTTELNMLKKERSDYKNIILGKVKEALT